MPPGNSQYLDELARSTTPLDQLLSVLKQDAVDRFKAGRKIEAKAYFKEGVIDAIKITRKDNLLNRTLESMFLGVQLTDLQGFEIGINRVINHVLNK